MGKGARVGSYEGTRVRGYEGTRGSGGRAGRRELDYLSTHATPTEHRRRAGSRGLRLAGLARAAAAHAPGAGDGGGAWCVRWRTSPGNGSSCRRRSPSCQGDPLGWAAGIARPRSALRGLDSAIVAEFDARGLGDTWFFAPDLEKSYRGEFHVRRQSVPAGRDAAAARPARRSAVLQRSARQPTAHDDRHAGRGAVRHAAAWTCGSRKWRTGRWGGPCCAWCWWTRAPPSSRWVHEVASDPEPAFGPAVWTSLAAHFADLVVSP